MANSIKSVTISIKLGPIKFPDGKCPGIDIEHAFRDGIFIREHAVKSPNTAYYNLTIRKEVNSADMVDVVEDDLVEAFKLLCYSWEWAGGGRVSAENHSIVISNNYDTNAKDVHRQFQSESDSKPFSASRSMRIEFTQIYSNFPLKQSLTICHLMHSDNHLHDLLKYYHTANDNTLTWYMDLYKIGDIFKKRYSGHKRAKSALQIEDDDWSFFEKCLNNHNLRHASTVGDTRPTITKDDKVKLFELVRNWIKIYLSILQTSPTISTQTTLTNERIRRG